MHKFWANAGENGKNALHAPPYPAVSSFGDELLSSLNENLCCGFGTVQATISVDRLWV